MRVSKEPEERKQEILNAAIEVFAKKGYEKTSISDIAQTINVAQGLCYRYFSSKEELFDAALNYLWDETVFQLRKRVAIYDIEYFYDVAVTSDKRKRLSGVEDLVKLDDMIRNMKIVNGAETK